MVDIAPTKETLLPLPLGAGMVSDITNYAAQGRWWIGDGVRFQNNYPEKIGGWIRQLPKTWQGTAQTLFKWADLTTQQRLAIGTTQRALSYDNTTLTDITPVTSVALGADPFASTNTLPTVVVTHTAHGRETGNYVRFSDATAFGGFTAPQLNAEYQLTVLTVNTYQITLPVNATSTTTGGGGAVVASYILASLAAATGWGAGGWGQDGWGFSGASTLANSEPGQWSFDNWGEDLLLNPRGAAIYYYDVTTPTVPAVNVTSLGGATDVPEAAVQILVEPELRYAIALGASPIGSSNRSPMFVRWADRGSVINWTPSGSTTAGGTLLAYGSKIVIGQKLRREIAIFTDTTLYSMQPISGNAIFQFTVIAPKVSLAGPQASCVNRDNTLFWMENEGFSKYDGRVQSLDCDVLDRVFDDFNFGRVSQVVCGETPKFFEVTWFYPSADSAINNRYVTYNYKTNTWSTGTVIKRSAWLSTPLNNTPIGASDDGLFYHEIGYDDNDTGAAVPIPSYILSAPFEVTEGNDVLVVQNMIPDISFGNTSPSIAPLVTLTMQGSDYPGGTYADTQASPSQAGAPGTGVDVRPFTQKLDIRVRGRKFTLRLDNNQLGVFWRSGIHRVRARKDGSR